MAFNNIKPFLININTVQKVVLPIISFKGLINFVMKGILLNKKPAHDNAYNNNNEDFIELKILIFGEISLFATGATNLGLFIDLLVALPVIVFTLSSFNCS
jgi:hypothetical protein